MSVPMEKSLFNQQRYLEAFIKTAQYLASLTIQQDIWSHIGKVLVNFFSADLAGFAERRADGEITGHHWVLPDKVSGKKILTAEIKEIINGVVESGFLATHQIHLPAPYSLALLPIMQASQTTAVMLVGHRMPKPLPKELLNVYLAVAGLVGITIAKLSAEQALYERQQEFMALVENAPDIIARFDKEFRHVYINPTVERETGMPPEVFIGKTNRELGTPEDLVAKWHEAIKSVFETGQERTFDTECATPTGIKYYSNRLAPELAEDGSVATVLNISRDITERKRAEEMLREIELQAEPDRTRSILEALG